MLDPATAVDQLVAANIYGLEELKSACELEIGQHIDTDNVFLLWQLCETHECPHLARRCLRYLEIHAGDANLQSHKDWLDMPDHAKQQLLPVLRRVRRVKP